MRTAWAPCEAPAAGPPRPRPNDLLSLFRSFPRALQASKQSFLAAADLLALSADSARRRGECAAEAEAAMSAVLSSRPPDLAPSEEAGSAQV